VTTAVTIDLAGGDLGGAARYRNELSDYMKRRTRHDIRLIGSHRRLSPVWLAAREATAVRRSRRIALNNVGFLTSGGERWTLLTNALYFLTGAEIAALDPGLRAAVARTAMAERIIAVLPDVADQVIVRMHPVSLAAVPNRSRGALILCPVLFAPYKHMADRIGEWLAAVDEVMDDSVRLVITASPAEVPASLATNPRLHFVGRLSVAQTQDLWSRCQAVYFPTGLESFGCSLAEARVNGVPIIARDTPQNREIADAALCGYTLGDGDSLRHATEVALDLRITPDPAPFDPDAYFDWMLGDGE
jgi:hypothetical protein